ncbi:MAG: hypothetical protein EA365_03020, partial [Gloeocapsa sp. DLM2.Bin57]
MSRLTVKTDKNTGGGSLTSRKLKFSLISATALGCLLIQTQPSNAQDWELTQTFLNPTPEDFNRFGSSVGISGNLALIGTPLDNTSDTSIGAAYLFNTNTGDLLQTFLNPTPEDSNNFSYSVGISGNLALTGTPNYNTAATSSGAAYLFNNNTGDLLQTFLNPTPENSDQFGYSVGISGNLALIG